MFYFESARHIRTTSKNLEDIRRKAILYLQRMSQTNVIDISSTQSGYVGNIYKTPDLQYVWSPAKGKRLAYRNQTYLGFQQSYLNRDGSLAEETDEVVAPVTTYRP